MISPLAQVVEDFTHSAGESAPHCSIHGASAGFTDGDHRPCAPSPLRTNTWDPRKLSVWPPTSTLSRAAPPKPLQGAHHSAAKRWVAQYNRPCRSHARSVASGKHAIQLLHQHSHLRRGRLANRRNPHGCQGRLGCAQVASTRSIALKRLGPVMAGT